MKKAEQYQQQIEQILRVQASMRSYLNIIQQIKGIPKGKIFIRHEKQRYCYSYPYHSVDVIETEVHLRKAFLEAGSTEDTVYSIFGATCRKE